MEFRRKVCELIDGLVPWERDLAYLLCKRTLCMSEQVTDSVAWCLLLADMWQLYCFLCFTGLCNWPFRPICARSQWALAKCLRCWLLGPRLPVEMRDEALDGLCVAIGTCLLADQEALASFPVLEFCARVFCRHVV